MYKSKLKVLIIVLISLFLIIPVSAFSSNLDRTKKNNFNAYVKNIKDRAVDLVIYKYNKNGSLRVKNKTFRVAKRILKKFTLGDCLNVRLKPYILNNKLKNRLKIKKINLDSCDNYKNEIENEYRKNIVVNSINFDYISTSINDYLLIGDYTNLYDINNNLTTLNKLQEGDCIDIVTFSLKSDYTGVKEIYQKPLGQCSDYVQFSEGGFVLARVNNNYFDTDRFEELIIGDFTRFYDVNKKLTSFDYFKEGDCVDILVFELSGGDLYNTQYAIKEIYQKPLLQCSGYVQFSEGGFILTNVNNNYLDTDRFPELIIGDFTRFYDINNNLTTINDFKVGDCVDILVFELSGGADYNQDAIKEIYKYPKWKCY